MSPGSGGRAATSPNRAMRLATCALLLAVAGCASIPPVSLYDDTRAKQAAAARADWTAVDVAGVIAARQANLQAMLDAENQTQDELGQLQVKLELAAFLDAPLIDPLPPAGAASAPALPKGLGSRAGQHLLALLGLDYLGPAQAPDPTAIVTTFLNRKAAVDEAQVRAHSLAGQLSSFKIFYGKFGVAADPDCSDTPGTDTYSDAVAAAMAALPANERALFAQVLAGLRQQCQAVQSAQGAANDGLYGRHGSIAHARQDLRQAQDEDLAARQAEQVAEADYAQAQSDYAQVLAQAGSATPAADKVQAAVERLQDKLTRFDTLTQQTGGRSAAFVAKLRLDELRRFVDGLATTEGTGNVPADAPPSVGEVILLTRLVDDVHALRNAHQVAEELPLQLMADQERLKLQAAHAAVAARNREIELLRQSVDNRERQADRLVAALENLSLAAARQADDDARVAHRRAHALPPARDDCDSADILPKARARQTFVEQFCTSGPQVRVRLLQAAVGYLDVVGRLEPQGDKLQYARLDALDRQSLAYSDANLQRWKALIAPGVDALADDYASGIAPQTIASLLQAAALVWIGHGVNK